MNSLIHFFIYLRADLTDQRPITKYGLKKKIRKEKKQGKQIHINKQTNKTLNQGNLYHLDDKIILMTQVKVVSRR
jgi:hypothetical protein